MTDQDLREVTIAFRDGKVLTYYMASTELEKIEKAFTRFINDTPKPGVSKSGAYDVLQGDGRTKSRLILPFAEVKYIS